ncbi:MAG: DNA-directed RNA polymerase subunit D [Candidatus Bathyarchaeota archaeon B63]|nr:MAG: DNA-directed RNA polymerase subunit D [Candidatus Bathyarchaeota archaeon B63]
MNVQILERNEDSMLFVVDGITASLANTLRRIILSEVPCMAIDDIMIIENDSVLHDEILGLRLGLIPLKTDLDSYNLPEECSCQSELGCPLCRTVLILDVEARGGERVVYSKDLLPENPDVAPVSGEIPIVKLAPGQRIRLEAYARLGRGREHAKWQPVSSCIYRHVPEIKVDAGRCDACGECVEICSRNVLERSGDKIEVKNMLECTICRDCMRVCPQEPAAISVDGNENSFIFYVESTGVMPVERIIEEAFKIYDKKYSEFLDQLLVSLNVSEKD